MFAILVFVLALLTIVVKYLRNLKYSDFDGPSPMLSLPLVGHSYLLGSDPISKLMEYRRRYGDMFRLDIGADPTIILCTQELTLEALRREDFNGRTFNRIAVINVIQPVGSRGALANT